MRGSTCRSARGDVSPKAGCFLTFALGLIQGGPVQGVGGL